MQPHAPARQLHQRPWWQQSPGDIAAHLQHSLQRWGDSLQQQQHPPGAQRTAAASPPPFAAAALGAVPAVGAAAPRSSGDASSPHKPVDKEELGRSSWVLLHTLAAQLPERPSRRQQRDVRTFMDSFARVYPCGDCAAHFQQLLRADPPDVSSGPAFQQWMCRAHNTVNRAIGKPSFNCDLVGARWAPLDCDAERSCDMGVVGRRART